MNRKCTSKSLKPQVPKNVPPVAANNQRRVRINQKIILHPLNTAPFADLDVGDGKPHWEDVGKLNFFVQRLGYKENMETYGDVFMAVVDILEGTDLKARLRLTKRTLDPTEEEVEKRRLSFTQLDKYIRHNVSPKMKEESAMDHIGITKKMVKHLQELLTDKAVFHDSKRREKNQNELLKRILVRIQSLFLCSTRQVQASCIPSLINGAKCLIGDALEYDENAECGTIVETIFSSLFSRLKMQMTHNEFTEWAINLHQLNVEIRSIPNVFNLLPKAPRSDRQMYGITPAAVQIELFNNLKEIYMKRMGYDKYREFCVPDAECLLPVINVLTGEKLQNLFTGPNFDIGTTLGANRDTMLYEKKMTVLYFYMRKITEVYQLEPDMDRWDLSFEKCLELITEAFKNMDLPQVSGAHPPYPVTLTNSDWTDLSEDLEQISMEYYEDVSTRQSVQNTSFAATVTDIEYLSDYLYQSQGAIIHNSSGGVGRVFDSSVMSNPFMTNGEEPTNSKVMATGFSSHDASNQVVPTNDAYEGDIDQQSTPPHNFFLQSAIGDIPKGTPIYVYKQVVEEIDVHQDWSEPNSKEYEYNQSDVEAHSQLYQDYDEAVNYEFESSDPNPSNADHQAEQQPLTDYEMEEFNDFETDPNEEEAFLDATFGNHQRSPGSESPETHIQIEQPSSDNTLDASFFSADDQMYE